MMLPHSGVGCGTHSTAAGMAVVSSVSLHGCLHDCRVIVLFIACWLSGPVSWLYVLERFADDASW